MAEAVPAFGRRVKAERERRGWSQRELARAAGLSPPVPCRVELGRDLTLSSAVAIARAFDVPLADLAGPFDCAQCDDYPPAGFTCRACGAEGADGG